MNKCTIQILCGGRIQEPAVVGAITLERTRGCEPSKLVFTCIKDRDIYGDVQVKDGLSFSEGSQVILRYNDVEMFFGYVFEKQRNKDHHIEVTCYDTLRYFKNKENYVFTGITLDEIVKRIAEDMGYPIGSITKSNYVIPKFIKTDSTMLDIINEAVGLTLIGSSTRYLIYDDYGKLCLKSQEEMQLDLYIDKDTLEDFNYTTSIDSNTYNQIVVKCGDGKEPYILNDKNSQERWGLLQMVIDADGCVNPMESAKLRLDCHNMVSRSFEVTNAFGDVRVRGGSGIYVDQSMMGDLPQETKKMWVERVTHKFDNGEHFMDLTLIDGKDFYNDN